MDYLTLAAIYMTIRDMEKSKELKHNQKINNMKSQIINTKMFEKPVINHKKKMGHPIIQPRGQNH
jgi:hypothetical protein